MLTLSELKKGTSLPELKRSISQENINRYAEASQDFNPIHIDVDFARKTVLGGTIAHGMLILAYASQMMVNAFGQYWLTAGKLNVRFKTPARPGDTITVSGKVSDIKKDNEEYMINCDLLVANQHDETIIIGEAIVKGRDNENSC